MVTSGDGIELALLAAQLQRNRQHCSFSTASSTCELAAAKNPSKRKAKDIDFDVFDEDSDREGDELRNGSKNIEDRDMDWYNKRKKEIIAKNTDSIDSTVTAVADRAPVGLTEGSSSRDSCVVPGCNLVYILPRNTLQVPLVLLNEM